MLQLLLDSCQHGQRLNRISHLLMEWKEISELTISQELKITIPFCEAMATRSSLVQQRTHLSSSPGTCQVIEV